MTILEKVVCVACPSLSCKGIASFWAVWLKISSVLGTRKNVLVCGNKGIPAGKAGWISMPLVYHRDNCHIITLSQQKSLQFAKFLFEISWGLFDPNHRNFTARHSIFVMPFLFLKCYCCLAKYCRAVSKALGRTLTLSPKFVGNAWVGFNAQFSSY